VSARTSRTTRTVAHRRDALLTWLRAEPRGTLTAREIVSLIGYPYDELGHYRESRCFDDLLALQRERAVRRVPDALPARWELSS
jgi:hypothetical protein